MSSNTARGFEVLPCRWLVTRTLVGLIGESARSWGFPHKPLTNPFGSRRLTKVYAVLPKTA
ncbi:hypothetical protein [Myxosarcina sp. GI1(2024)]